MLAFACAAPASGDDGQPINSSSPTVSGPLQEGGRLSATTGSWSGDGPLNYGYQWLRCGSSRSDCAAIDGATDDRYRVGRDDVGAALRVPVEATGPAGSAQAQSPATAAVDATADYAAAVLGTTGLAHFWRLSETGGGVLLDSAGTSDATACAVALGGPMGPSGDPAARFNGASSYASAPVDLSAESEVTVEFWLNWARYADDGRIAVELTPDSSDDYGGLVVVPNDASGKFAVAMGHGESRSSVVFARPSAGGWHHYALVLDRTAPAATQITPYVDGKSVTSPGSCASR